MSPADVVSAVLCGAIRGYQLAVSPWLPPSCRFSPSCSQYALEAVHQHGPGKGIWLSLRRLSRCHPFSPGGIDLVPKRDPASGS